MPRPSLVSHARNGEDVVLLRSLGDLAAVEYALLAVDAELAEPWTGALDSAGWHGRTLQVPDSPGSVQSAVARLSADGVAQLQVLWIAVPDRAEEAFLGLREHGSRPWIVLVQAPVADAVSPSAAAAEAGYRPLLFDGISQYYLSREREELADALSYPPCSRDEFFALPARGAPERDDALFEEIDHWRRLAVTAWADAVANSLVLLGDSGNAGNARQLENEIVAMRATLSWRVTRPLRIGRRMLGRIRSRS